MEKIVVNGFNKDYLELTKLINDEGIIVDPRGKMTKELSPFTIKFNEPTKRILSVPYRDINPFFLVVESLWILAGRESVYPLNIYNNNISQFSDDGFYFHAPYGARLRNYGKSIEIKTSISATTYLDLDNGKSKIDSLYSHSYEPSIDQLKEIYLLLKKENNTRQAVASIWNPIQDLNTKTKDIPCNDLLMFKIRENKLRVTICNRSNDLHWGLPTNLFQFSSITEVIAFVLGIDIQCQVHFTDSLHIYKDINITDKILKASDSFNVYDYVSPEKFSLEEEFNLDLDIEDKFDKTFFAIETAMFSIESFDNLFLTFLTKFNKGAFYYEDIKDIFNKIFDNDFYLLKIKKQSLYLASLVDFSLAYFLFKKSFTLLNKEEYSKNAVLFISLNNIALSKLFNTKQKDYLIVGCNFLYTRYINKLNTKKESWIISGIEYFCKTIEKELKNVLKLPDDKFDSIIKYVKEMKK